MQDTQVLLPLIYYSSLQWNTRDCVLIFRYHRDFRYDLWNYWRLKLEITWIFALILILPIMHLNWKWICLLMIRIYPWFLTKMNIIIVIRIYVNMFSKIRYLYLQNKASSIYKESSWYLYEESEFIQAWNENFLQRVDDGYSNLW